MKLYLSALFLILVSSLFTAAQTAELPREWVDPDTGHRIVRLSDEAGSHNTAAQYIANPTGPDAANYLKLTVSPNGSFKVFNSRTGETKDYAAH